MIVPYVWLAAKGVAFGLPRERYVTGFADPALRFSMNFIGAPALTAAEFKDYRQNFIFGASLRVTAPLGQYDNDKLVNIGTNRWSLKPEIGFSKAFGRWTVELAPGVTFYTDNGGQFMLVKASITLFVLGASFLLGGLKHHGAGIQSDRRAWTSPACFVS